MGSQDKGNKDGRAQAKIKLIETKEDQLNALRSIMENKEQNISKDRLFNEEKAEGEAFYADAFGEAVDFTDVKILPRPKIDRNILLLFMAKGTSLEKIVVKNQTPCLVRVNPIIKLEDINSPYSTHRAYAIWVANGERPDLRLMNARGAKGKRIMTVEERVLLGIKRFQTAIEGQAKYLDFEMATLTSSLVRVGKEMRIIVVRHQNGGMYVDVQDMNTPGGAREVFE